MKTIDELGISPAPWSLHTVGSRVFLRDANEKNIAQVYAKLNCGKATPNESLIAAAPDLYHAAYMLVKAFDNRTMIPEDVEFLRSALAKAGGAK